MTEFDGIDDLEVKTFKALQSQFSYYYFLHWSCWNLEESCEHCRSAGFWIESEAMLKKTLWIQLKQLHLTVHWFPFSDMLMANCFSLWLWILLSTMLPLTAQKLTCTYKDQTAHIVIWIENTKSSQVKSNRQITKHRHL